MKSYQKGFLAGGATFIAPTIRGLVGGLEMSEKVYRHGKNKNVEKVVLVGCAGTGTVLGLAANVLAAPILLPVGIVSGVKEARKD